MKPTAPIRLLLKQCARYLRGNASRRDTPLHFGPISYNDFLGSVEITQAYGVGRIASC